MTAFDRAWNLVKMPYYHGASSADLESIMEHGLRAPDLGEATWETFQHDKYGLPDDEFDEMNPPVFMSDNPRTALNYAIKHGEDVDSNPKRMAPHRPVIFEIDDEIEEKLPFHFNPEHHDFRVDGTIPPELLRLVYEGDEYDSSRSIRDDDVNLMNSDWYKKYMAMGDKRHPPFVLREGLY